MGNSKAIVALLTKNGYTTIRVETNIEPNKLGFILSNNYNSTEDVINIIKKGDAIRLTPIIGDSKGRYNYKGKKEKISYFYIRDVYANGGEAEGVLHSRSIGDYGADNGQDLHGANDYENLEEIKHYEDDIKYIYIFNENENTWTYLSYKDGFKKHTNLSITESYIVTFRDFTY